MEPSATVRERILKQVREEGRSRTAEDAGPTVLPFVSRSPAMSYGLIAAGIVCTLLISWIAILSRQNRAAWAELAKLKEQNEAMQAQLTREREFLSPGSKLTPLAGTPSMPGAQATLAYNPKGQALLIAQGLPPAPAGKGYQIWFIVDNKPLPGKVFTTDASGNGMMRDQMPSGVDEKAILAITMEDYPGGAPSPTSPILLRSGL
jgi:hypothetical protein